MNRFFPPLSSVPSSVSFMIRLRLRFPVSLPISLEIDFPETVKVAVLIDGNRFAIASTYLRLWNILKINADATIFCFHINETDMMLRSHRMRYAAHLHLNRTSIQECHLRNMLLITCIHRVRNQLLHSFTAAHHRNPRVHNLDNHIAAMTATSPTSPSKSLTNSPDFSERFSLKRGVVTSRQAG